jgi:hypothetical protein
MRNLQHRRLAAGEAPWLALPQQHRTCCAVQQPGDGGSPGPAGVAVGGDRVIAIQHQHAEAGQDRFAFPQPQQDVEVGSGGGQALGGQDRGAQAQQVRSGGGDRPAVGGAATELHCRQLAPARFSRPDMGHLFGHRRL